MAKDLGISTVVTANGIDELFCGYNAYREAIGIGVDEVMNVMNTKLENEKKMMIAVNNVTSIFNVKILQPLLNEEFISFAKTIPISEKIIDLMIYKGNMLYVNLLYLVVYLKYLLINKKRHYNMVLKFTNSF